jgi:hypothetical protein
MKIKATWKVTDEDVSKTKVEFSWESALREINQISSAISTVEGYCTDSTERNILKEFGRRLKDICDKSKDKLKDSSVEVEIDPNPNSIKL